MTGVIEIKTVVFLNSIEKSIVSKTCDIFLIKFHQNFLKHTNRRKNYLLKIRNKSIYKNCETVMEKTLLCETKCNTCSVQFKLNDWQRHKVFKFPKESKNPISKN